MPISSADQAVIESFDVLVREIHATSPHLTRLACVRGAAVRNPKLHQQYIIASNPEKRQAAVELVNWRRDVRRQK